jgi:hypothetical protein
MWSWGSCSSAWIQPLNTHGGNPRGKAVGIGDTVTSKPRLDKIAYIE